MEPLRALSPAFAGRCGLKPADDGFGLVVALAAFTGPSRAGADWNEYIRLNGQLTLLSPGIPLPVRIEIRRR